MFNKILNGGMLAGHRTYIISGIGILAAVGGYIVGDSDIFTMLQTIFPLAAIYFLRSGLDNNKKGTEDGNSKKISK